MTQNPMTTTRAASTATERSPDKSVWRRLLLTAGYCILPYLPDFLAQVLDLPNQVMANGYSLDVKKGDFEVIIGRDIFSPLTHEEGGGEDD